MKLHAAIITILLTIGALSVARSQCSMGGGSRHNHTGSQQSEHKQNSAATSSTKGYAFINDDGIQEVNVIIQDGYQPNAIVVKRGILLRLNFDLEEEGCTGTVVMKEFHIEKKLNPHELGTIEFTPTTAGSYAFSCPMHMIEGTLIVKE